MKSYFSLTYLWIFLPLLMLLYQAVPQRHRWKVLLGGSYVFYWLISGRLIVFLLIGTGLVHWFGLWLTMVREEKDQALTQARKEDKKALKAGFQKKLRGILLLGVGLNLGLLVVLKYTRFFGTNVNSLLRILGLSFRFSIPEFLMPLGISFYTLEAVSYLIDVYRGTIPADRSLGRIALYLGFFPQIMEGPICRYSQTALQLWEGNPITYHAMTFGFQRILWGTLKKLVIADHLNEFVRQIFSYPGEDGGMIAFAAICYTVQLYMEFSGTMDMVIGTGEIFGITLPENFQQPFFSKTISEFWLRWHITLGAWFRDYVFYPVSMSGRLKHRLTGIREKFGPRAASVLSGAAALFCVWILNGLWHGDGWQYLFFGLYHFTLILLGTIAEPCVEAFAQAHHLNRQHWAYRTMQVLRTGALVVIGELFFRAETLTQGLQMFEIMVTRFTVRYLDLPNLALYSLEKRKLLVLGLGLLAVLVNSILREKKIDVRQKLADRKLSVRWGVYAGMILYILLFGAYGLGYIPVDPIYAQF